MMGLTLHRTKARHLPHEPLLSLAAAARVVRKQPAALFGEIKQDRAALEHRQRRAAAYGLMVDDRGQAAVGVDPPIFGRQMIALEHVKREQLLRKPDLFEHDRDLVSVRRGGDIHVDHAGFTSAYRTRAAAKAVTQP